MSLQALRAAIHVIQTTDSGDQRLRPISWDRDPPCPSEAVGYISRDSWGADGSVTAPNRPVCIHTRLHHPPRPQASPPSSPTAMPFCSMTPSILLICLTPELKKKKKKVSELLIHTSVRNKPKILVEMCLELFLSAAQGCRTLVLSAEVPGLAPWLRAPPPQGDYVLHFGKKKKFYLFSFHVVPPIMVRNRHRPSHTSILSPNPTHPT